VRVEVIRVVRLEPEGLTVLPTLTKAQFIVPKPLIVHALFAEVELFKVIEVVTVRTTLAFTASVPEVLLKEMELQVLLPSTVKVNPAPIIMSSLVEGIVPPGHGALGVVELQFPLPVVVTVAKALNDNVTHSISRATSLTLFANNLFKFIYFMDFYFKLFVFLFRPII
jgi:hypothetical protein